MERHPNTAMLLTEATENAATKPLLETWSGNERMRHLPPLDAIVRKLDGDIRRCINELHASFAALPNDHARRAAIEEQIRCVCRALDRFADAARHARAGHAPNAIGERLQSSLEHAVSAVRSVDANLFGRRYPVQTHERSKAEPIVGGLMTTMCHVEKLTTLIREVDPHIDERLLANLVVLDPPLRRDAIA